MVKKQGGKIACGQCHQFFKEDELILDEKNNRYLCDGCYEPRDQEPEDREDIDDGDDDIDDDENPEREEMNPVRAVRGEARVKRIERTRITTKKDKEKSLIW
jgi:hypothetical protein